MVIGSFVLSVVGLRVSPAATFYLLPTRIWELGIGALIAAGGAPRLQGALGRGIAAWAGMLLIGYGVFGLSEQDAFPGWNALYPCLGAGLIIAYGAGTSVGTLLGSGPCGLCRPDFLLALSLALAGDRLLPDALRWRPRPAGGGDVDCAVVRARRC